MKAPRLPMRAHVEQRRTYVGVREEVEYPLLGVRWYGGGAFIRETITSATTSAAQLQPAVSGDLIYNRLFAWKQSFAVLDETHAGCYASNEFPMFGVRSTACARFLKYCLITDETAALIDSESTGATAISRNRWPEASLMRLLVPSPTLDEQARIADFLDDQVARIDSIIAARQSQLNLLREYSTGRLSQAVFDTDARKVPLSSLAQVRLGRQRSPQSETGNHMTRYLRSANVSDGRFDLSDVKEMNFDPRERAVFELQRGDVLVTEGAGSPEAVGAAAMWDGREPGLCFQNTLVRLRPRGPEVASDYLGWWARTSHRSGAMRTWATGANILHIGSDGLKRMPIPAMGPAEQAEVVRRCETIDAESSALAAALSASVGGLQELKRSLITAAVSGDFDGSSADGSRVRL
jgi:type I restriction enzyme S subunit